MSTVGLASDLPVRMRQTRRTMFVRKEISKNLIKVSFTLSLFVVQLETRVFIASEVITI